MVYHQAFNSEGDFHFNGNFYGNREWKPHFHRNCEWVLLLEGRLEAVIGGKKLSLEEGECALVLPGQIHAYRPLEERTRYYIAVFSGDHVPELVNAVSGQQGSRPAFRLSGCAEQLVREYLLGDDLSPLMRRSCLCAVCDEFLRKVPLEPREEKADLLAGNVLHYIREHYAENISLKTCAAFLGYEYHYLSRILSREYRLNFRSLLNQQRLEKAMELLRKRGISMAGAAAESGFQSVRSFNGCFLRVTGTSPLQWLKQQERKD